jgi:hypothetical protein
MMTSSSFADSRNCSLSSLTVTTPFLTKMFMSALALRNSSGSGVHRVPLRFIAISMI